MPRAVPAGEGERFAVQLAPLLSADKLLGRYKGSVYDLLPRQQQRSILEPLQDSGTLEHLVSWLFKHWLWGLLQGRPCGLLVRHARGQRMHLQLRFMACLQCWLGLALYQCASVAWGIPDMLSCRCLLVDVLCCCCCSSAAQMLPLQP